MGDALQLPQMHLKRVQNSGIFYVKGRGEGQGKRYELPRPDREVRKSLKSLKLFVPLFLAPQLTCSGPKASANLGQKLKPQAEFL